MKKKDVEKKKAEVPVKKSSKPEITAQDFIDELKSLDVKTNTDAAKNIGVHLGKDSAITYIANREYGIAYYIKRRVNGHLQWFFSGQITTKAEMMEKVTLIKEYAKNKNPEILVKLGFLEVVEKSEPKPVETKPTEKEAEKSVEKPTKVKSDRPVKIPKSKKLVAGKAVIDKIKSRIENIDNGSKGIDVSAYEITKPIREWIRECGYRLSGTTLLINKP